MCNFGFFKTKQQNIFSCTSHQQVLMHCSTKNMASQSSIGWSWSCPATWLVMLCEEARHTPTQGPHVSTSSALVALCIVGRRHDNNKIMNCQLIRLERRRCNASLTSAQLNTFPRCWTAAHTNAKLSGLHSEPMRGSGCGRGCSALTAVRKGMRSYYP